MIVKSRRGQSNWQIDGDAYPNLNSLVINLLYFSKYKEISFSSYFPDFSVGHIFVFTYALIIYWPFGSWE